MGGGAPAPSQHGQAEAAMSACRICTRFPARHSTRHLSAHRPAWVLPAANLSCGRLLFIVVLCRERPHHRPSRAHTTLSRLHFTRTRGVMPCTSCSTLCLAMQRRPLTWTGRATASRWRTLRAGTAATSAPGLGPTPATSAPGLGPTPCHIFSPGLGSALPLLHRNCAQAIRREDQLVHGPHKGNQNPMGARPYRTPRCRPSV